LSYVFDKLVEKNAEKPARMQLARAVFFGRRVPLVGLTVGLHPRDA